MWLHTWIVPARTNERLQVYAKPSVTTLSPDAARASSARGRREHSPLLRRVGVGAALLSVLFVAASGSEVLSASNDDRASTVIIANTGEVTSIDPLHADYG